VVVTVRLPQKEVDALDRLTVGQFSRSQIMRIVLQDFLKRSEKDQKQFLISKAFG
jgi:metal-responsive CopG/Arc/MetJ family transcriptional regulator